MVNPPNRSGSVVGSAWTDTHKAAVNDHTPRQERNDEFD